MISHFFFFNHQMNIKSDLLEVCGDILNITTIPVKSALYLNCWIWAVLIRIICFHLAATHRQAEHPGGLTSAVPVRQQVLRCGEKCFNCKMLKFTVLSLHI